MNYLCERIQGFKGLGPREITRRKIKLEQIYFWETKRSDKDENELCKIRYIYIYR